MKMLRLLILLVGLCPIAHAQIADNSQLRIIITNASVDSIQKIERLAAILFHDKINAHRSANGKTALGWDDTLWLASRNHNTWMMENTQLGHMEKAGTKSFSGVNPGDRYDYVSKNKGKCSWSGENALYNYSAGNTTIEKNAEQIAEYSFQQWKNSPGHNANMLSASSKVHGVAFMIESDGQVWATDLFGRPSYAPIVAMPAAIPGVKLTGAPAPIASAAPAPTTTAAATTTKSKDTKFVSASAKYVKLDLEETTAALQSALYQSSGMKKSKALSKAAQRHAEYMAANQKLVHDEKKQKRKYYAGSPHQRIVKASRGTKLFHKRSAEYIESIAMIQADAALLDAQALSKIILLALDKEKTVTGGTVEAVGFGIVIRRIKNELRIYIVREEKSSQ
ncbi:hypothetical protein BH11BAC7_BH11BAC7_03880 [soil metagenome]